MFVILCRKTSYDEILEQRKINSDGQLYTKYRKSIQWAVRLSWLENAYSRPLFGRAILTGKVEQADLLFDVRSGFISRCVYAIL